MTMNRRELLQAALLASAAAHPLPAAATAAPPAAAAPAPPDLGFLKDQPLVNADRARYFMRQEGFDALVVSRPANVFYLSNHWPQLGRMGFTETMLAVYPADPRRPLALVMPAFSYFYTHSPESAFEGRLIFPFTQAADPSAPDPLDGSEPAAAPSRAMPIVNPALMTPRELGRIAALESAEPLAADASWALARALGALGLQKARLGIDDPALEAVLRLRGFDNELRPAEDTLRRIRMAKSEVEIRLMRLAAQQNVDAAMAAAAAARDLGSTRQLRARFFAEAASRGNLGVFMVINGTSSEVLDEPIGEGMAFSIDCVSSCRFYHGDFARTIFVGEPRAEMRRACAAIATAWTDIQGQLKAGLRFADVSRLGRESLRRQGVDLNVSFTPHSVGLFHTDHPGSSLLGRRSTDGLVLEENMILSVDCPVLQAGMGGTAHLEDLMLIRKDGAEPIHGVPRQVVVV